MLVQLRVSTVQQLALGFSHSMSIGKHGDTYTWGTDENGSLGHGFKWPTVAAQHPAPVPLRLQSGAAGWKHTAGEARRCCCFLLALHAQSAGGPLQQQDAPAIRERP
jgi:alpha-tubulin suppressor-like RCC1 family protein